MKKIDIPNNIELIEITICGGGGGGGYLDETYGGGGGGSGYINTMILNIDKNSDYYCKIGKGGISGNKEEKNGKNGERTIIYKCINNNLIEVMYVKGGEGGKDDGGNGMFGGGGGINKKGGKSESLYLANGEDGTKEKGGRGAANPKINNTNGGTGGGNNGGDAGKSGKKGYIIIYYL